MTRLSFLVSAFASLALCLAPATTVAEGRQHNGPRDVVTQLYRDFSWEAVLAAPESDLVPLHHQPSQVLRKYFTPNLTKLIVRDDECSQREGMCALDFLPIWDSQDAAAVDLTIESAADGHGVVVRYRYPSNDQLIELKYDAVRIGNAWRISDIHYKEGRYSLVKILKGDVK